MVNPSSHVSQSLLRTYRITPIQQPLRSAAFEKAYLSRLPLSPPLIIQLDCWDARGEQIIPWVLLVGVIYWWQFADMSFSKLWRASVFGVPPFSWNSKWTGCRDSDISWYRASVDAVRHSYCYAGRNGRPNGGTRRLFCVSGCERSPRRKIPFKRTFV